MFYHGLDAGDQSRVYSASCPVTAVIVPHPRLVGYRKMDGFDIVIYRYSLDQPVLSDLMIPAYLCTRSS